MNGDFWNLSGELLQGTRLEINWQATSVTGWFIVCGGYDQLMRKHNKIESSNTTQPKADSEYCCTHSFGKQGLMPLPGS